MPVIDIHTHMMSDSWFAQLRQHGAPQYSVLPIKGGYDAICEEGAPFLTLTPAMFDYELRLAAMDSAGVDIAVVTLTAPNVYWGTAEQSTLASQVINDDMREAQVAHPDRIRFMASLPWQFPELAARELARACKMGAVGVMVLANVRGRHLTDPLFDPIWKAIDDRGLPVFIHPARPPGAGGMDLAKYNLTATVAFCFDTTLAVTRMVMDGFLDRYPNLKIIAAHGGGYIPYVNGRISAFHALMENSREKITDSPNEYFRRIYYDAVVYQDNSLRACIDLAGPSHVLYGSDYPHVTGDMPGCLARVDALPSGERAAIRGANAQALFRL